MTRPPRSPHFRLQRVAPGVHVAIASLDGAGLCNAGIVDLGGATLVFDSMLTPAAGADLARAALRLTGRRAAWVVNSHWHGDHIWGNGAFPTSHVVSSRLVRLTIRRRSRRQFDLDRHEFRRRRDDGNRFGDGLSEVDRRTLLGWSRGLLGAPPRMPIVAPDVTFSEELNLEGSRRQARLITYGGGHSPSDVFAYLPDDGLLLVGDLSNSGMHPSVSDGDPRSWARILQRIDRLSSDSVLPGHGPFGPRSMLASTRRYLEYLDRIARTAVRRRATLRELLGRPLPREFRDWNFRMMYPGNVRRAFQLARRSP